MEYIADDLKLTKRVYNIQLAYCSYIQGPNDELLSCWAHNVQRSTTITVEMEDPVTTSFITDLFDLFRDMLINAKLLTGDTECRELPFYCISDVM